MAQFQPPIVFLPGQVLTASDLNAHISSAVVLPGVITDQTVLPTNTAAVDDKILIYDTSATALRQASVSDLLNSGITTTTGSIVGKTGVDVTITPAAGQKTDITGLLEVDTLATTAGATIQTNLDVGGTLVVGGVVTLNATSAVKIPVGTTAQRPGTPATGQLRYNTTTSNTEIYNGTTWEEVGGGPFDATGGNKIIAPDTTVVSASFTSVNGESVVVTSGGHSVTPGQIVRIVTAVSGYSGDYQVIAADATTFTYVMPVVAVANSGSCTYQKAGNFKCHIFTTSGTFTATGKGGNVEVLCVGGGGGGGNVGSFPYGGAGGGGGAVVYYPYYNLTPGQVISVTVGSGGAISTNGTASTFGTISAGGGNGASGYVGGASGVGTLACPSNSGTTFTYNSNGGATIGHNGGGGGAGGAAQNGGTSLTYYASGQGGAGKGSSIVGIPKRYGGGGSCSTAGSSAGVDGGGGFDTTPEANSGGGGGSQQAGAAGIVIVRYPYWL